ncbi:MAG: hypothetical protein ABFQ95_05495 [Pseudomonadota bacterium]
MLQEVFWYTIPNNRDKIVQALGIKPEIFDPEVKASQLISPATYVMYKLKFVNFFLSGDDVNVSSIKYGHDYFNRYTATELGILPGKDGSSPRNTLGLSLKIELAF